MVIVSFCLGADNVFQLVIDNVCDGGEQMHDTLLLRDSRCHFITSSPYYLTVKFGHHSVSPATDLVCHQVDFLLPFLHLSFLSLQELNLLL